MIEREVPVAIEHEITAPYGIDESEFIGSPRNRDRPKAAQLLRELRNSLRHDILRSAAFSEYLVHQVLRLMIERCEALNLYVGGSRRALKPQLLWVIARLAESYEERQLPRVSL